MYDEDYAKKLRADEYGMSPYVLALLKRGPNQDQPPAEAIELQKGHLANIRRLSNARKILVAGPFTDGGDLRGLFIFDVTSIGEARELAATDPAIQAGRLALELHPWYGSVALREVNATHERVARSNP